MNHSDVQRFMPDYLEGDLALDLRAPFDAHLDDCVDCAHDVAGFRSTISALRHLPDPGVPGDLTTNVMRRIRMGEGRTSLLDRLRDFGADLFAPRILAPVSAALLVAGVVLGTGDLRGRIDEIRGGVIERPERLVESAPGIEVARRGDSSFESTGAASGSFGSPRTQGQELIALSQLMEERSLLRTQFNDWPAVRPASVAPMALNPVGPIVERSTSLLLPDAMVGSDQRWPSADEWLVHVRQKPGEFADLMAMRTLAEQELWIDRLARRALDRGELEDVVVALRASGSERARILADDFAAASPAASGVGTPSNRRD